MRESLTPEGGDLVGQRRVAARSRSRARAASRPDPRAVPVERIEGKVR